MLENQNDDDIIIETSNQNNFKKSNKYPVLLPNEEITNKLSSNNLKNIIEEQKDNIDNKNNKSNKNIRYYRKNKSTKKQSPKKKSNNIYNLETDNDIGKTTNRKFQSENQENFNQSIRNSENKEINTEKNLLNKKNNEKTEEKEETEEEKSRKIQEKIKNEYEKYEINLNKEEGNNTNIVNSLHLSKLIIILRIILYNLIRPIYIYLLIVSILLCIPSYTDLPIIVSVIIYLIIICTSIVIEVMEETKAQNRNIFFDQKTKYCKITNNKILNVSGKNIQNGDIIAVKMGDFVPCDMIIIDSSINEIPLYFQSECLTGTFNFNVRLVKQNLLDKMLEIKNGFEPKFAEFIKNLQKEELEKMLEEQNKVRKSKKIYTEFLERNGILNEEEEMKKKEEEKQKRLMELRFDPNNKIYEELKNQEYYKSISENLFKGDYYLPKDKTKSLYYLSLYFPHQNSDINNILEINEKNMCFCGERIKNAMWIIGIAVHIGEKVKPLKDIDKDYNSFSSYYKKRKTVFEGEIDYYFYILLTILIMFSIIAGVINMIYVNVYENIILYNDVDKNRHPTSPVKNFYHSLLDYFCLMHTIVPYTIFFTLEIVLLFQKLYINNDIDLFNKNKEIILDSKQIEDLGKVDLILTDKTGTLTRNERYFKYCVVADGCYEYRRDIRKWKLNAISKNYKKTLTFSDYDMINSSSYKKGNGIIDSVQYDGYIVRSVQKEKECIYLDRTEKLIEEFWKGLALCHDAIPVFKKNNLYGDYYLEEKNKNEQKYFSNSADNTTLVEMASKQGFTFFMDEKNTSLYMGDGTQTEQNNKFCNLTNCDSEIILGEPGEEAEKICLPVRKLCHLKFHSQRKRESVIVKEGNYIKLYVKGPIDEILPRIIEDYTPKKLISSAKMWLRTVEDTGCRAFIMAMRILTQDEYDYFINCYKEANIDTFDTKKRINKVIDSVESNLTFLGGAFIEDLLPKKIEDAISNIKNAGVKIWTVTGDKVSSSYNVGIATGIIDKNNEIIIAEINQEALLEKQNIEQNIENNILTSIKNKMKSNENQENEKENEEIKEKEKENDMEKEEKEEKKRNEEKKRKIEIQLKNVLKSFNKEFKDMQKKSPLIEQANKFDIVIDSLSFREISKTPQNIKSFFDKALLANSLTFCDFNSNDKKLLVQHIKSYIKGIKNINSYTIMGVGDGFNDIEMLKEVDIGVGINNGINKNTKINIDNFVDISRLIMFHGINNLKRNSEIVQLLLVRHFMFGFIFFIYGCHCWFSNVNIIPTQDIYLCLFILNLIGPFLKGIFDINVFYFYDKKEKIENNNEIEVHNSMDSYKNDEKNQNKDENNEYIQEQKEKKERKKNRMLKNIFDHSFKYIYLQKNLSLVESGSEHIPYKKYLSINKFIFLIFKSIFFCLLNFYLTYGAVEHGHNIIDLDGNMIDFRRLQIILWTNYSFIIFFENEIFTYYFTVLRIIEIVLFVCIYLIIFILYQRANTQYSNPFKSFLLFLDFLLVVCFCSSINFGIYVIENLFDHTVVYKLRNMKDSEKYLEEMKILVDYKEEPYIDEDEDDEDEEMKKKENEKNVVLEIMDESQEKDKIFKDISTIKKVEGDNILIENDLNNNLYSSKVIISRKNKRNMQNSYNRNNNDFKNNQQYLEFFNKNLIGSREIKNSQLQDSINFMHRNRTIIKEKENEKKAELKYVNKNNKNSS